MTKNEKEQLLDLFDTIEGALFEAKVPRAKVEFQDDVSTITVTVADSAGEPVEPQSPSINSIAEKISQCTRCVLSKTRKNVVPGMGVENPVVMVIGEGPGEQEDIKGLPFVGPAGQLLDKMLSSIGLSRQTNCYITNIVKCRPPHNRNPETVESDACDSFLKAQIAVLKPKVILVLGSPAVKHIFKTDRGITSMRGQFFEVSGIPAIATYHPSALLRDPSKKIDAWTDLKTLRAWLQEHQ